MSSEAANEPSPVVAPSFRASLLTKIAQQDFSDLRRLDVLCELLLIAAPTVSLGVYAYVKQKRSFQNRLFLETLNLSLNIFDAKAGRFVCRTLEEIPIHTILPPEAVRKVKRTAVRSQGSMLLELPRDTEPIVFNRVANRLSSLCAPHWLAIDNNVPIKEEPYVLCLSAVPSTQ
eukprot:Sspe_Gene.32150::Locus_15778_Transcript_1_1_Confidence_1.000_Length_569::g.32150::m.32150